MIDKDRIFKTAKTKSTSRRGGPLCGWWPLGKGVWKKGRVKHADGREPHGLVRVVSLVSHPSKFKSPLQERLSFSKFL